VSLLPLDGSYDSAQGQENFGNFSNEMPTLQRSFRAIKGRGFGDGPVQTRGSESIVDRGSLFQATGGRIHDRQINQPPRAFGNLPQQVQSPALNSAQLQQEQINLSNAQAGAAGMLPPLPTQMQRPQPAQLQFGQQQQRGGMFNQQNQFNPQGMQQMMQFMQQMMQMFSMMGGQNRGGGFGGQQQYQQPQRYQPQQYQPPPRQQFQPVQQQYGQMGPQQPSPFAQSIRPRY